MFGDKKKKRFISKPSSDRVARIIGGKAPDVLAAVAEIFGVNMTPEVKIRPRGR